MAASLSVGLRIMFEPMPIVSRTLDGRLVVNKDAMLELQKIDKELVVVCIWGPYRTGKSYLMNRIGERCQGQSGFELGSSIETKTKGVWAWVRPHPKDDDKCLVLLDAEGSYDDADHDERTADKLNICRLSMLLSSTFILNGICTVSQQLFESLETIYSYYSHLQDPQLSHTSDRCCYYDYSDFIYISRDFFLDLEIDGRQITADEYLEHILSASEKKRMQNNTSKTIKTYFNTRKCFVFVSPCSLRKLKCLDKLSDGELDPEFVEQCNEFVGYIHDHSRVKRVHGIPVNGKIFVSLIELYMNQMDNGTIPYIDHTTMVKLSIDKQNFDRNRLLHTILRRNYAAIVAEVDPKHHVLDYLYQEELISQELRDEIRQESSRNQRSRLTLDVVLASSNTKACIIYIDSLKKEYHSRYDQLCQEAS